MENITYQTNEQLWKIENAAASAGYKKTDDCYWAQIFRNEETGHEFSTSREENSTNDPVADLYTMLTPAGENPAEKPADPHKNGKMFASEKWYNIELAWYEWEGFRETLKKDGEEWGEPWIYEASECGVDADGEKIIHVEIKCAPADLPYLNELLMESAW